jgi:hypothetical protein
MFKSILSSVNLFKHAVISVVSENCNRFMLNSEITFNYTTPEGLFFSNFNNF